MKERISYVELQVEIDQKYLKKCSTRSQLYAYTKEHKWTLFGGSFNSYKQALLNIDIDYSALPLNEHELRDEKIKTLLNG